MDPIKLDANDGVMVFDLGTGGSPCVVSLDLYRAYHAYGALFDQHPDDVAALDAAWCEWLQRNGFPALSGWAAYTVARTVNEKMADLKKKLTGPPSPSAASPASTGSPPSA